MRIVIRIPLAKTSGAPAVKGAAGAASVPGAPAPLASAAPAPAAPLEAPAAAAAVQQAVSSPRGPLTDADLARLDELFDASVARRAIDDAVPGAAPAPAASGLSRGVLNAPARPGSVFVPEFAPAPAAKPASPVAGGLLVALALLPLLRKARRTALLLAAGAALIAFTSGQVSGIEGRAQKGLALETSGAVADGLKHSVKDLVYQDKMIALWRGQLALLTSTREEAAFLKRDDVDIRFDPSLPHSAAGGTRGTYEHLDGRHVVSVGLKFLADARREAEEEKVPAADVAFVVALKSLPTVVHELRHGIDSDGVLRAAGERMEIPVQEAEVLAKLKGLAAVAELAERFPLHHRVRLALTDRGQSLHTLGRNPVEAARVGVLANYDGVPILGMLTDGELARRFAAGARASETDLRLASTEHDRREALTWRGRFQTASEIFADPARAAKLRAYFAAELKELEPVMKDAAARAARAQALAAR